MHMHVQVHMHMHMHVYVCRMQVQSRFLVACIEEAEVYPTCLAFLNEIGIGN